ncbi:MAG: hypothetical protein Q9170_000595 [Blastenia crenularia]
MHTVQVASILLSIASLGLSCSSVSGVKFTAYGFPDASGTPAYACNGNTVVPSKAGGKTVLGDGSFGKPYSAAAAAGSTFAKCEMLYMPLLKKYFRIQDDCSGCVGKQTDLYIAQFNTDVGQTSCEQQFGSFNIGKALHQVIKDPGAGFPTNTQPLFTQGNCFSSPSQGRVFPDNDGKATCGANAQGATAQGDTVDGAAAEVTPAANTVNTNPTGVSKGSGAGSATASAVPAATKVAREFRA